MGVSLALITALAISGTLAYLTERDSEANVFTVGDVTIDLQENYIQNSQLMPGMSVTKEVMLANAGTNDAWVWYTYAVPSAMVNYLEIRHAAETPWILPAEKLGETKANGIDYTVYLVKHRDVLPAGKGDLSKTSVGMQSVSLAPSVDFDHGSQRYFESDHGKVVKWIDYDIANTVIYVNAYAIQEENFGSVDEAYTAFLGQWGGGAMLNPDNF